MPAQSSSTLQVRTREPDGSRQARRLRRQGRIPGVLYGGEGNAVAFDVDARELRLARAASGAVVDLSIDGGSATPVVIKEAQRDPVRGDTVHVDLLRVRLDKPIHATVALELTGADDAPGAKQGGVLEHVVREVNIEALPTAIPHAIEHDVSGMEIGDTVTLGMVTPPAGVALLDDPEIVVATLSPPRLQAETESEIEAETALVGEAGEAGAGETGESAGAAGGGE